MDQRTAIDVLLAYACCNSKNKCNICPWNDTEDCKSTSFFEVLDDAIDVACKNRKEDNTW